MRHFGYILFHPRMKYISLVISITILIGGLFSSLTDSKIDDNINTDRTTIVLDVSNSMNVLDGNASGVSRLKIAKEKIGSIIQSVPHEFGLTVFSGTSQRVIPHTSDIALYMTFLEGIDRGNVSEGGTNIQGALKEAILDFQDTSGGNIILISDGGEESLDDLQTIKSTLEDRKIQLYIVGVGTKKGGYIPQGYDVFGDTTYTHYQGKIVVSSLEKENLQKISGYLGANYSHIEKFSFTGKQKGKIIGNKVSITFLCIMLSGILWFYFIFHLLFHKYHILGKK